MSNPPQTLGQYQIIREIARSNDIVYEAYDPLMHRRVAVKELHMPNGMTPQQLEDRVNRFRREAQAVGSLNHPNIMTVFSFSQDGERYFMAMEFLDGTTLRKEIDNRGFLDVDRAIEISAEVLDGLATAHTGGVVHRDIKPDNVQIISSGQVKITDFGIARLTFQPNLTMDGQVFGTPSYMSPEQVVGKEIDNRTDLFSVGVMLYEMLTGSKPFTGDNVIAITHSIINTSISRPQQINLDIWNVISRSLEKAPQMRYTNAKEMRQALLDALQMTKSPAPPAYNQPDPYNQYSQAPSMLTGQPSIVNTPYGTPYGGVQPQTYGAANPYGSPYIPQLGPIIPGQQAINSAPPVINAPSYGAYNPYQQPTPGQFQPPPGYNVYYPPPPGPPLFSLEAKERMRQYLFAFLFLGLIVGIIIVAFNALASSAQKPASSSQTANRSLPAREEGTDLPKGESASETPTPTQSENKTSKLDLEREGILQMATAEAAETPDARASAYLGAAESFYSADLLDQAFIAFNQAYNVKLNSGAPQRELRKILYRMQDVFPVGSSQRPEIDADLARLSSGS
jgi:eukaryotic-like serine/threonine-protein kinase